ncbi:MAG TPA: hypothetical protein ENJ83_02995, partial [Rhodospirillales bacterium]|nr:hypothetical protein [Rhodospirillales bacterium]
MPRRDTVIGGIARPVEALAPARRRSGHAGLRLLAAAFLLWPLSVAATVAPPATETPRDVRVLARLVEERVARRDRELERLERRLRALDGQWREQVRRAAAIAGRLERIDRDLRRFAREEAAAARALAVDRERDRRARRDRERAALALLARLRRQSGSGAVPPARLRLLVAGLLRESGRAVDLASLEMRRRELARARASLAVTRARLERVQAALSAETATLDRHRARLALARVERLRRRDAARARGAALRSRVLLVDELAGFEPPAVGLAPATPPLARTVSLRVAEARGLEASASVRPPAPAGLGPSLVPPAPPFPPPDTAVAGAPVLPVAGRILWRFGDERAGIFARGITVTVERDQPVRAVRGGRVVF